MSQQPLLKGVLHLEWEPAGFCPVQEFPCVLLALNLAS